MSDDRRDEPFEDSLLDLPLGPGEAEGGEPSPGPAAAPPGGPDGREMPLGGSTGDPHRAEPGPAGGPGLGGGAPGGAEPGWQGGPAAEPPVGSGEAPRGAGRRRNRLALFLMVALVLVLLLALAGLAGYLLPRPSPALVRVEPAMVDFGARSVVGAGGSIEVILTSSGERPAEIERAEVLPGTADGAAAPAGSTGAFRLASDACSGATVVPDHTCAVAIAFDPATPGVRRATLRIDGDFANAPLDLPLLGEGVAPHVRVDRQRIDFAARPVGAAPAEEVVTLENDGTAPLDLDAVVVSGAAAEDFSVAASGCTRGPLRPGESCPVSVGFSPVAEGSRQATLELRPGPGSRGIEPPSVALSGTGLPPEPTGRLGLAEPAGAAEEGLGFGAVPVGRDQQRTVRLVNRGERALEAEALAVTAGGGPFAVASDACSEAAPLAPGATCEVVVRFAPSADGAAEGTLSVGEPGTQVGLELALRGNGVVPRLVPKPTALDFGESRVGRDGPVRKVTFASTGSGVVDVQAVALGGTDPGAFAVRADGCSGKTLTPGASCSVEVGFQPRQEGVQSGRLMVRSPSLDEPTAVALHGAGAAPRIGLAPRGLDFGRVAATRSDSRSLTVTSAGRAPLEIRRIDVVGADSGAFTVTAEDCTAALALAPGDTCRVTVRFAPSSEGDKVARLRFTHDGEGSSAAAELAGTALPAPVPRFSVTPERVRFGEAPVGGRSAIETVTVRNAGSDRLVLGTVRIEGEAAGDFRVVPGSCEGAPYVSPGSECTIGVRFTPQAAGARRARLVIPHNAAGGTGRVGLQGTGTAGGQGRR